jgi:hypothetical protein
MQRTVQLNSFGEAGRIVTISPRLYILLDPAPIPAAVLPLEAHCGSCKAILVSWALPGLGATTVSCACTRAVCKQPYWTAEGLAENWAGVVAIRSRSERAAAPPSDN